MITARDIELFRKLSVYGMLSTKQVGQLVFNSIAKSTVCRRLRLLEAGFYVRRIRGLESYDHLWVLADRGAKVANVEVPKRHWSKSVLHHDFKLLSLRLALEGSGLVHSWKPEHEIKSVIFKQNGFRAAKEKLVPDGLLGIEVGGYSQTVAVEVELKRKSFKRYGKIIRRYSNKPGLHAVWYLSQDKAILNLMLRIWRQNKVMFALPTLYVSLLDEVIKDPLQARLQGGETPKLIGKTWTPKRIELPAHTPAQGVSTQNEKIEERKVDLTAEDHTPIRENCA